MSQAARVSGEFAQETFERWKEIGTGKTFQGARFERCAFDYPTLAQWDDAGFGLRVRDVTAIGSTVRSAGVHGVRFGNVEVDRLHARGGGSC